MNVTQLRSRSLLLVVLVALLALAAGLTDGKADFRQCGQAFNGTAARLCDMTGANTNIGTAGDDVVSGSAGNDEISLDGSDLADGNGKTGPFTPPTAANGGNDLAFGGPGDDVIVGGTGNDTLMGDQGNDVLCGGSGNDTLFPGPHTQNDDASTSRTISSTGVDPLAPSDCGPGDDNGGNPALTGNDKLDDGEETVQGGPGDDKIWVFASDIARNAVLYVDCSDGLNDTVNLVGFGVQGQVNITGNIQTRINDPINGDPANNRGQVVLIRCERINGSNGAN